MDFKTVIIDLMCQQLESDLVRDYFWSTLKAKQKAFTRINPAALMLDQVDLVATHIAIYKTDLVKSHLGNIRVLSSKRCEDFGLKFPFEEMALGFPAAHRQAFLDFKNSVHQMHHFSHLFVNPDPEFKSARNTVVECLHWCASNWVYRQGSSNFCGLSNSRFQGKRWLKRMGKWPELSLVKHPQSPDKHELILMKEIESEFVAEGQIKFGKYFENAEFLIPEEGKDQKILKAA